MVVNKRSKNSRQRGSHTHGWGAMKKHRGAGNRGGAGKAGTGKRSDSKKPSIWKNTKYFGKHGFVGRQRKLKAVNIGSLEEYLSKLTKKPETINLRELGFNKLLNKGKVTKKIIVTCEAASASAIKSIESAGGKVILPKKEEVADETKGHTSKPS